MTKINKLTTNFNLIFLFFIQQSITQNPPVVPLTNAITALYCHNSDDIGIMTIRCGLNEKIRMLDAYDVVVKNKSHLPLQCLTEQQQHVSSVYNHHSSNVDCKIPTSFTSACSGRENCTLNMQRVYLNTPNENCRNELVDYTMAFFECISDVFIHDVCSSQAITSTWGTLKTPNFPNPYTSNDDCWCKLSTQLHHKILLTVIVFQLIPYDQKCAVAGLYLQSGDEQGSTQCTYLPQGYNYLSDTNSLYINFYSQTSTVRGGFWIIYEANHPNAEVHLQCGSRENIGVPLAITSFSSSYNQGWTRLVYNDPTTIANDQMMHMRLYPTTPSSFFNNNFKISYSSTAAAAFTYPYGRLTTFELDYGPKGWFLKYLFGSSNMTATKFLQTTTQLPVIKWNSTWRYIRRLRPRIFTRITTKIKATTISTTTTTTTTIPTTTLTSSTMGTSIIETIEQNTNRVLLTTIPTTTFQSVSTQQDSLFTKTSRIDYSTSSIVSSTIVTKLNINSISSSTSKTTIPSPTPWYPPEGPFDWWQRQWYATKIIKVPTETPTTTQQSTTTTTQQSTTTTQQSTTIVTTVSTTTTTAKPPNITSIITLSLENTTTTDWFKEPDGEFTSTIKSQTDYDEDEYNDWPDDFATTKIQPPITINPLLFLPPKRQGKKFQQMNYLPSKSNEQFNDQLVTSSTPTSKRYSTSLYTSGISERNSVGSQLNEVTKVNSQNFIEQKNKKSSEENGWLSKTDMTIVSVSIIFVILLAIVNLILFAVRKHRHRIQGRHLISASSLNTQRMISNDHLQNKRHTVPINSFINTTNNNNNDILPAVGEIVIWDEKDQGGYTIDNHGEWAKIDGHEWRGDNISQNCNKQTFSKSFRSRFQFIRQSNKKGNHHLSPKSPQHAFKYPLLMDTASLSPVPEVDDYRLSEIGSEATFRNTNKTIKALIHKQQDQNTEYYKQIELDESESEYTTMHGTIQEEYSLGEPQTDRSVRNGNDAGGSIIISVPTMLREEDETTDCGDSIYNQNYSIHSFENNKNLHTQLNNYPKSNSSIIIGHCQTDFQPLDPNLLLKSMDKSLLTDHQQFYSYSQSLQISTYDSGFFDDQTMNNSPTGTNLSDELEDNNQKNISKSNQRKNFS